MYGKKIYIIFIMQTIWIYFIIKLIALKIQKGTEKKKQLKNAAKKILAPKLIYFIIKKKNVH